MHDTWGCITTYSSDTTKYLIHIHLTAEGVVEKPDVVGAIFGQTEGLLGEDLDLRDLQRTGRVGRIDVQVTSRKGETKGEILISSSLDRAETAILAASIETIDRVGPCAAHVAVESIEDIRVVKRRIIVERAKELLTGYFSDASIDSYELLDDVRESIRIEKICVIGEDKVPAGPNVLDTDAIIVVEGRADVINLLKFGIKNAVAVEGTKVSGTIIELTSTKTATAFLDGDRGGELILRELLQVADIDYVASSPRGKSVEDLTRKEVIKALRNKVPVEYVRDQFFTGDENGPSGEESLVKLEKHPLVKIGDDLDGTAGMPSDRKEKPRPAEKQGVSRPLNEHLRAVRGHHIARFLSSDYEIIREMQIGEVELALDEMNGDVKGVVLDSEVNQRLLDHLVGLNVEYVAAREFKGIIKRPLSIRLLNIV
ncbi:MAG: DNA primase DnaG [Methanomicrobiales archaeon]|nr:DNA primase DnaG [Methanomicrobiales archaeon]